MISIPAWWPRVKVKLYYYATHYTWAFVAVMAVTLLSCLFSIHYLSTLETDLKDVYENDVRGGDSIQGAYTALLGIESASKDLVVFADKRKQARARENIRQKVIVLKATMKAAAPRFYTPKAKQALESSKEDLTLFLDSLSTILSTHDQGKRIEAATLANLSERSLTLQRDFDLLVANRIANSSIGVRELVGQLRLSLIVTIVILVVTVVVRIVLYVAGHPNLKRRKSDLELPGK